MESAPNEGLLSKWHTWSSCGGMCHALRKHWLHLCSSSHDVWGFELDRSSSAFHEMASGSDQRRGIQREAPLPYQWSRYNSLVTWVRATNETDRRLTQGLERKITSYIDFDILKCRFQPIYIYPATTTHVAVSTAGHPTWDGWYGISEGLLWFVFQDLGGICDERDCCIQLHFPSCAIVPKLGVTNRFTA